MGKIASRINKEHNPLIHKLFIQTLIVMIIAELASSLAIMLDGII